MYHSMKEFVRNSNLTKASKYAFIKVTSSTFTDVYDTTSIIIKLYQLNYQLVMVCNA